MPRAPLIVAHVVEQPAHIGIGRVPSHSSAASYGDLAGYRLEQTFLGADEPVRTSPGSAASKNGSAESPLARMHAMVQESESHLRGTR
jgi:hypothetical protein